MTREVIQTVDRLGKKEKQPLITKGGLMFEWGTGQPIINDEDDPDTYDDDYESDNDDDHDNDHTLTDDEYATDDDLTIKMKIKGAMTTPRLTTTTMTMTTMRQTN